MSSSSQTRWGGLFAPDGEGTRDLFVSVLLPHRFAVPSTQWLETEIARAFEPVDAAVSNVDVLSVGQSSPQKAGRERLGGAAGERKGTWARVTMRDLASAVRAVALPARSLALRGGAELAVAWWLDSPRITVADVPAAVTDDELRKAFSQWGELDPNDRETRLQRVPGSAASKGVASVLYKHRRSAHMVVRLLSENHFLMRGSPRPVLALFHKRYAQCAALCFAFPGPSGSGSGGAGASAPAGGTVEQAKDQDYRIALQAAPHFVPLHSRTLERRHAGLWRRARLTFLAGCEALATRQRQGRRRAWRRSLRRYLALVEQVTPADKRKASLGRGGSRSELARLRAQARLLEAEAAAGAEDAGRAEAEAEVAAVEEEAAVKAGVGGEGAAWASLSAPLGRLSRSVFVAGNLPAAMAGAGVGERRRLLACELAAAIEARTSALAHSQRGGGGGGAGAGAVVVAAVTVWLPGQNDESGAGEAENDAAAASEEASDWDDGGSHTDVDSDDGGAAEPQAKRPCVRRARDGLGWHWRPAAGWRAGAAAAAAAAATATTAAAAAAAMGLGAGAGAGAGAGGERGRIHRRFRARVTFAAHRAAARAVGSAPRTFSLRGAELAVAWWLDSPRITVMDVPAAVTDDELRKAFSQWGDLDDAQPPRVEFDAQTRRSTGAGAVTYRRRCDAARAVRALASGHFLMQGSPCPLLALPYSAYDRLRDFVQAPCLEPIQIPTGNDKGAGRDGGGGGGADGDGEDDDGTDGPMNMDYQFSRASLPHLAAPATLGFELANEWRELRVRHMLERLVVREEQRRTQEELWARCVRDYARRRAAMPPDLKQAHHAQLQATRSA
eukprot:g1740.t1